MGELFSSHYANCYTRSFPLPYLISFALSLSFAQMRAHREKSTSIIFHALPSWPNPSNSPLVQKGYSYTYQESGARVLSQTEALSRGVTNTIWGLLTICWRQLSQFYPIQRRLRRIKQSSPYSNKKVLHKPFFSSYKSLKFVIKRHVTLFKEVSAFMFVSTCTQL